MKTSVLCAIVMCLSEILYASSGKNNESPARNLNEIREMCAAPVDQLDMEASIPVYNHFGRHPTSYTVDLQLIEPFPFLAIYTFVFTAYKFGG